jgi:uncharacterized membrane protein YozB (DUF420 family)
MRKAVTGLVFGITVLLAALLSFNALSYFNFDPFYGFLRLKQEAIATGWYMPAYYAHVLVAAIILLIAIFQVYPPFGMRWRKTHKTLGKVYVFGVLFFSAPGGLIMSLFINRGEWVTFSFVLQSLLWWVFTLFAFTSIRKGDIIAHRAWMFRSVALTLAAITLRVYAFMSSSSIDLTHPASYTTISWLSWGLNLLIVELYLLRFPKPGISVFNQN